MTRTQTRTYGVVTPPHIQPLLDVALRAFAWLVSNVALMLATIFNRPTRDWHAARAEEGLLPTPSDICAPAFILRDDRFAIPQDEASGRSTESRSLPKHDSNKALILRDLRTAQIVSKDGGVLTALLTRITRHALSLSSRKPRSGYPGPIRLQSNLQNGSRLALRLAGMTTASANPA